MTQDEWFAEGEALFGPDTGPCNYAGGGLFGINPVDVDGRRTFAFAKSKVQP